MNKPKLIRITTVPLSLEKLLEGQLEFMQNYFVVTAISSEKERLEAEGKKQGVATFYLEMTRQITPIKDIAAVFKLYHFLKKEKPFIVHSHTPKAGVVGMMAAWLARVPNRLHTVAGLPLMETTGLKRKVLNFVEKLTYRFATKIYPNSHGLYDYILTEKFTKSSKLSIIGNGSSNGIDSNYFNPTLYTESENAAFRKKMDIPQNHFLFIFVGRLVSDKGINELIAAFSKLEETKTDVGLLLVGPLERELDPLLPSTLQSIEKSSNIFSVGYQIDVRPFFAIADALVFPSYREGFPNVVMQAGAMGLPSIVTNINGCNEIIIQDVNGLIVPPKDEEKLYKAMNQLASDAVLHSNLKSISRSLIVDKYSRKEVWEALLMEYKSL